jgi:hypothetical protein
MSSIDFVKIILAPSILSIFSILISFLLFFSRKKFESNERIRIESLLANLKATHDKTLAELKANIDTRTQRAQLVDKTQFMHEYELYKEAWTLMYNLNQAINNFEKLFPMNSQRENMESMITTANKEYFKYIEHLEKNKPFYPEKIFQALSAISENFDKKIIDYATNENHGKEYLEKKSTTRLELKECTEKALIAIRERIAEVRVI